MKKLPIKTIVIALFVVMVCAFAVACADNAINTDINGNSSKNVTLSALENVHVERNYVTSTKKTQCVLVFDRPADAYDFVVTFNDAQYKVSANRCVLKNPIAGKEYFVKVYSKDKTGDNVSEEVSLTFTHHNINSGFEYLLLEDGTYDVCYQRAKDVQISGTVYFPDTIDGKDVSTLESWCLGRYKKLPYSAPEDETTLDNFDYHGDNKVTTDVVLPHNLKKTKRSALALCTNLKEVTFPISVEKIAFNVFGGSGVVSATLPDGADLEYRAFYGCPTLKNVNLDAAGHIGGDVMNGTAWLAEHNEQFVMANGFLIKYNGNSTRLDAKDFPADLKEICGYAFDGNKTLEYICVPLGVKLGTDGCFVGTEKSFEIDLSLLSELPDGALKNANIYNAVLPEGITEIPEDFFYGTVLKTIELPRTVQSIGDRAFCRCSGLESIDLSDVTTIGNWAFSNCTTLSAVDVSSAQSLGENAFYGCTSMTTANLPDRDLVIGEGCFQQCSLLKNIDLSYLSDIAESAFYFCVGLEKVDLPSAANIADYAFYHCKSLETVVLSSGVEVGERAFADCPALSDINVDACVKIGKEAFSKCTSLLSVTLSDNIAEIGKSAFIECTDLASVYFNADFDDDATGVFEKCTSLSQLTIGDKVTKIQSRWFYNCQSFKILTLPDSVISIGGNAFFNCTSLETVNFGNGVEIIEFNCFRNCSSLKTLILPDSVKTIGESAFSGCILLENVTLSRNLESIGGGTFSGCSALVDIVIPESVTQIGPAFTQCTSLKSVTINMTSGTIVGGLFRGCDQNIDIWYGGTAEEWSAVAAGSAFPENVTVWFYSDTEPALNATGTAYDGNYWHYDESGNVVVWKKQ